MPGVQSATINFDESEALVKFDAKKATPKAMSAALEEVGYKGSVKSWPKS